MAKYFKCAVVITSLVGTIALGVTILGGNQRYEESVSEYRLMKKECKEKGGVMISVPGASSFDDEVMTCIQKIPLKAEN